MAFDSPPTDDRAQVAPQRIDIRPLDTLDAVFTASRVLAEVWEGDRSGMPPNLLRAIAHSGNYAVGLYDADRMVGASVAFFAAPAARSMHSHITGVLPGLQSQGLGRRLKLHQREWALARDVGHITWTFDPLVARNAHFNLRVLGTRVTEYLVNHYGPMDDGVNRGDESDRIMVSWARPAPPAPPPPHERVVAMVAVPHDIAALRRESASDAAAWRVRVRDDIVRHLAEGLVIGGFDDERGYLLVRP
jgi:predicted GNAT superfamily acetyltransferase